MKITQIIAGAAGLVLFATASLAAPINITRVSRGDESLAGTHQFYLWCVGSGDRIVYQNGNSAQDARDKLLLAEKAAAHDCRPAWQGRIPS